MSPCWLWMLPSVRVKEECSMHCVQLRVLASACIVLRCAGLGWAVLCLCCFFILGKSNINFFLHGFWTLSHSLKSPSLLQGNKVLPCLLSVLDWIYLLIYMCVCACSCMQMHVWGVCTYMCMHMLVCLWRPESIPRQWSSDMVHLVSETRSFISLGLSA